MDDIFGGLPYEESLARSLHFRSYICETGKSLTLDFNMKETKTPLPAKEQVILGNLYNSVELCVRVAEKKCEKYIKRIRQVLSATEVTVNEVQKLHGNLNFAAETAPFGRPFLAHLTNAIRGVENDELVQVPEIMKMGLRI